MPFENPFGADVRQVHRRTRDGQPARVVSLTRDYTTTVSDLWDAVTNPERLPRWFLPVSGDLKTGGRYQLEGNAGGKIERCDPPDALDLTWEFGGNVSWVTVRLTAVDEKTRLTLEHIALLDDAAGEHWEKYGPGAGGVGWDLSFLALGFHIDQQGALLDPAAYETWAVSAAGKQFSRACAKAWSEAHIASGTAPERATAMADRTAAFYCGE